MVFDTFDRARLTPGRIAALYLVLGLVALFVSDVVFRFVFDGPVLGAAQAVKGAIEVLATAGLLYLLVRWSWRDLRLQQRAVDAAPIGVTLTDPDRADNPLVFANARFEELTGYDESTAVGRNCRFLQGPETTEGAVETLREAIDERRPASVDVVNYRANGEKFWNKVDVAPVRDASGRVANFVGFQTDITERKVREERLRVLNRVLRHNVRNKMTVIGGHAELLESRFDDPPSSLAAIQTAAEDLRSLTETVHQHESVLEAATNATGTLALDEQLRRLVDDLEAQYPNSSIRLELPDEPILVRGVGLLRAIDEAVENAVKHNDREAPTVEITVETDGDGWLAIDVDDDGPGIPETEVRVLTEGETPLKHADRLGIWSIHWIVSLTGGSLSISDSPLGGTRLRLSVPTVDA